MNWWWGLFVFSEIAFQTARPIDEEPSLEAATRTIRVLMASDLLWVIAGFLTIKLIREVTRRQSERAERRRAAYVAVATPQSPPPSTTDAPIGGSGPALPDGSTAVAPPSPPLRDA
jgi:hypothetical protein